MIVGRDGERAVLNRLVDAARGGEGGCLVVRGEPGIGKTALLDDLIAHTDIAVMHVCGHEWEADLPYAALGELLRPVLHELDDIPPPQALALRNALGIESATGLDPVAVEVATATLLRAVTERRPLLLVVDDLPWLDSASRDVLLYVARRAAGIGLAIVIAARDETVTQALAALPALRLGPLSADAAEALVRRQGGAELGAPVRDTLVDLGRGNPLALQELVDGLSALQRAGHAPITEPVSVSTETVLAFRERIDHLPAPTRTALVVAAAEGRGRIDRVAAALGELDLQLSAFDAAEDVGLISIRGESVEFRHPLVRSVVYQTATPANRRATHAALAAVEPDPDRRAWHLGASVAHPDRAACEALVDAARRALARGADATAAQALSRAAELAIDDASRGGLYVRAARAANRGGDAPSAERLLEVARPLVADDVPAHADLVLLDGDLRVRRGDFEHAYRALAAEADAIAPIDARRAMTLLLMAAKAHVYKLEGALGLQAVDRAIELAEGVPLDMMQLSSLAMTRVMAGHPDARRTAFDAAREGLAKPRGHLHALGIAWPLIWLEEFEEARRFVTWSSAVQREGGYHSFLPQSLLPQAELDFRTGAWDRALAGALEAAQLFADTNQAADAAIAAGTLARIEAARGHIHACTEHAEAALDGDRSSGLLAATAYAESALGQLELSRRRFDRAVTHLSRAVAVADRGGVPEIGLLRAQPDLVEALAGTGHLDEASALTESITEWANVTGRPWVLAVASRCRGLTSPHATRRQHFVTALGHHDRSPTPLDAARTHLCFAEWLVAAGEHDDAWHHGSVAVDIFTNLGARLWADAARSVLRSLSTGRRTSAHPLSVREEEVARLVASGASNKHVANALFVNTKTVEYHLANIYRKLGVRTRTELAVKWHEHEHVDIPPD